jgi:hypothetical protein
MGLDSLLWRRRESNPRGIPAAFRAPCRRVSNAGRFSPCARARTRARVDKWVRESDHEVVASGVRCSARLRPA